MIPTLADLEAYRFFGYPGRQLDAMRIDKSLGPVSWAEINTHSIIPINSSPSPPTIIQVMRLVQTHCPDSPAPALDHIWRTRGIDAQRSDLLAYWEGERAVPHPWVAAGGVAVDRDQEIINRLEEIKRLLVYLNNSRPSVNEAFNSEAATEMAGSDVSAVLTDLASSVQGIYESLDKIRIRLDRNARRG